MSKLYSFSTRIPFGPAGDGFGSTSCAFHPYGARFGSLNRTQLTRPSSRSSSSRSFGHEGWLSLSVAQKNSSVTSFGPETVWCANQVPSFDQPKKVSESEPAKAAVETR